MRAGGHLSALWGAAVFVTACGSPFTLPRAVEAQTVPMQPAGTGRARNHPAQAEPSLTQTATARALFEEGMQAVDRQDWATAADRLARSLELRSSAVVRVNYALTLIELDRVVEATEHLEQVLRDETAPPAARQLARERQAIAAGRIGRLRVQREGDGEVFIDGLEVPNASLGVGRPADPGRHVVALFRRGRELASRQVTVEPGREASVTLRPEAGLELAPFAVTLGVGLTVTATLAALAGAFWATASESYAELERTCASFGCSESAIDDSGVQGQLDATNGFVAGSLIAAAITAGVSITLLTLELEWVGGGSAQLELTPGGAQLVARLP